MKSIAMLLAPAGQLFADAPPSVPSGGQQFVEVINNGGGMQTEFASAKAKLVAWGGQVRIGGQCNSACTILYTLPNACLLLGARLGFHSAQTDDPALAKAGNGYMLTQYRAGVRAMHKAQWQFIRHGVHRVWRKRMRELDPAVKFCEEQP